MEEILKVANGFGVWITASLPVLSVLVMAVLYTKLAYNNASKTTLSKADCNKALRSGMISSIGPSIAVFVVILSLASLIGTPMAWMRLSIIGGAATEMAVTNIAFEAAGSAVGADNFNLDVMSTAWFAMGVNGCGWLLVVFLIGHKMEGVRQKMGGGDPIWLGLLSVTATLGLFSYLAVPYILKFDASTAATVAAGIIMAGLTIVGKKFKWLKEYALTFALIVGATIGTIMATMQV